MATLKIGSTIHLTKKAQRTRRSPEEYSVALRGMYKVIDIYSNGVIISCKAWLNRSGYRNDLIPHIPWVFIPWNEVGCLAWSKSYGPITHIEFPHRDKPQLLEEGLKLLPEHPVIIE
jgi:hypothetical protein